MLDPTAFLPSKSRSAPRNNLWPSSLFCLLSLAGWSHAVPWLYVSSRHWLQILYPQSSSLPRPPNLYVQQTPPRIDLMGLLEFIHIKQRLDSSHPKPFLHQFSHLSKSHHYYPGAQAKSTFDFLSHPSPTIISKSHCLLSPKYSPNFSFLSSSITLTGVWFLIISHLVHTSNILTGVSALTFTPLKDCF